MAIELKGMPRELWRQIPECARLVNEPAKNFRKMVRMVRLLNGGDKELTEGLLVMGPDFSELEEIVRELIGVLRQLSLSLLNITGRMPLLPAHIFQVIFSYI